MRKWYPALLIAATIVVSVVVYPRLPDQVPRHWNWKGNMDASWGKGPAMLWTPVILLAVWGLMHLLPRIDPRRANYAKMEGTYELLINAVLTIIAALHFAVIGVALGVPIAMGRIVPALIGGVMVVVGNVLPRARPNWWFGIRTPWTLSNDRVWERTHRLGGYVLTLAGVGAIIASLFSTHVAGPAVAAIAIAASLGVVAYSYVIWKKETAQ